MAYVSATGRHMFDLHSNFKFSSTGDRKPSVENNRGGSFFLGLRYYTTVVNLCEGVMLLVPVE